MGGKKGKCECCGSEGIGDHYAFYYGRTMRTTEDEDSSYDLLLVKVG